MHHTINTLAIWHMIKFGKGESTCTRLLRRIVAIPKPNKEIVVSCVRDKNHRSKLIHPILVESCRVTTTLSMTISFYGTMRTSTKKLKGPKFIRIWRISPYNVCTSVCVNNTYDLDYNDKRSRKRSHRAILNVLRRGLKCF